MTPGGNRRPETLALAEFLPFRLNRLSEEVSRNLSEIYRRRFGLDVPDWRVLATVGQRPGCAARYIVASTRMHKTRVSRSIASLEQRALLQRSANAEDTRERRLRLTKTGRKIYSALVPAALERERALFSCLTDPQRQAFIEGLACLENSLALRSDE